MGELLVETARLSDSYPTELLSKCHLLVGTESVDIGSVTVYRGFLEEAVANEYCISLSRKRVQIVLDLPL